jgi:exo-beta-1,3-glucanase (GH17 family)
VLHTYPLWENYDIDMSMATPDTKAIDYTKGNWHSVADQHTDIPVVIGEAGWATQTNGNVQIVPGAPSEEKQQVYYQQLMAWSAEEKVYTFVFEAFDENWKGSENPTETEKHWGLFNSNRTPKLVMKDKFSDLMPTKL